MSKISCMRTLTRPVWVLKKNGLWPVKELTTIVVFKFVCNIVLDITTLSVVLQNIIIAIKAGNIKLLNWMTCVLFPLTNYFAKTIPLWINKEIFFSTLDDLNSTAFNSHSEELNKHVQTIDAISKLILRYFALAMSIFISISCLLPFFTKMPPMVPAPFNTGKYDAVYKLMHFLCTSYLAINSASIDVFYMSLIALCAAQLTILEAKLIHIFEDARTIHENDNRGGMDIAAEDILKECIVLHETISRFVKKLCTILAFPLFIQYAYGSFIICNTILQLTILGERDTTTIIGLCGYSGIVFAQMSAYHWLGNEVIYKVGRRNNRIFTNAYLCTILSYCSFHLRSTNKSDKIIEAVLLSKWYNLNLRCQRYLVILMERGKRTLTISLYKLVFVSLASLGAVVRGSYSVFALIKARYN